MRANISNPTPMDTLSFSENQEPFNHTANVEKSVVFNVSSNVYYGYQPLRVETEPEPMHTDDLHKSLIEVSRNLKRKRGADKEEVSTWKRRCHYGSPPPPPPPSPKLSPTKRCLEEDLLRETHGCSYYHWISSNV